MHLKSLQKYINDSIHAFMYLPIRLWAWNFYEVIVDEAKGRINYHLIEIKILLKQKKRRHFVDNLCTLHLTDSRRVAQPIRLQHLVEFY